MSVELKFISETFRRTQSAKQRENSYTTVTELKKIVTRIIKDIR